MIKYNAISKKRIDYHSIHVHGIPKRLCVCMCVAVKVRNRCELSTFAIARTPATVNNREMGSVDVESQYRITRQSRRIKSGDRLDNFSKTFHVIFHFIFAIIIIFVDTFFLDISRFACVDEIAR